VSVVDVPRGFWVGKIVGVLIECYLLFLCCFVVFTVFFPILRIWIGEVFYDPVDVLLDIFVGKEGEIGMYVFGVFIF